MQFLDVSAVARTEGVETGIAIREATNLYVKACYNTTVLEKQESQGEEFAIIFADKDRSFQGQLSAFKLCRKLKRQGVDAYVVIPTLPITGKGVDWLNELRAFGAEHIRNVMATAISEEEAIADFIAEMGALPENIEQRYIRELGAVPC